MKKNKKYVGIIIIFAIAVVLTIKFKDMNEIPKISQTDTDLKIQQSNNQNEKVTSSKVSSSGANSKIDYKDFDFSNSELYNRVLNRLDKTPESIAFAHWTGIGNVWPSDQNQYLFNSSVTELNKNPEAVLVKISEFTSKLANSENFLRSLSYSAVSHLTLPDEQKQEFYSSEIISSFSNVEKINDNAERLGLGLEYFSQTHPSEELVLKIYKDQIAQVSNKNEIERIRLYWSENFKQIKF